MKVRDLIIKLVAGDIESTVDMEYIAALAGQSVSDVSYIVEYTDDPFWVESGTIEKTRTYRHGPYATEAEAQAVLDKVQDPDGGFAAWGQGRVIPLLTPGMLHM